MGITLLSFSILFAGILSYFLLSVLNKKQPGIHPVFMLTFLVVPFASGGFPTWTAFPLSALLMWFLYRLIKEAGFCKLNINLNSVVLLCLFFAFTVTPLWAADKGMAVFGVVRFLPVLLFSVVCMQLPPRQQADALPLIPLCGAVMTLLCFALQFIPGLHDQLTVNGRLSGTFDYPNTYAAFLLAGLMIQGTKDSRKFYDGLIDTVLIFGVIISGSRTAFLLLAVTLGYILIHRPKMRVMVSFLAAAAIGILLAWVLSYLSVLENADRYTTISVSAGTFLVRLLYFKDALGVIVRNPFGLGYWGYRAMEGTFQTGRYAVSFVHNGLLQLLLDVGWIPALTLAAAFVRTLFSKSASAASRGVLLIVLAHCMLDFDLQFSAIWFLLICVIDLHQGKTVYIRKGTIGAKAAGAMALAISLWLCAGEFCMTLGNPAACLKITPFHTEALIYSLSGESDSDVLLERSERILDNNPYASIAYSVYSNEAFRQGDILSMCIYKEQAIACAKYSTEEYCDYLDKLYTAYLLYLQAGDRDSALFCGERILNVETAIRDVTLSTSNLAYLTGDSPTITLPAEYLQMIEEIRSAVK